MTDLTHQSCMSQERKHRVSDHLKSNLLQQQLVTITASVAFVHELGKAYWQRRQYSFPLLRVYYPQKVALAAFTHLSLQELLPLKWLSLLPTGVKVQTQTATPLHDRAVLL